MSQNLLPLYPMLFTPIYKEKVWGGRALENLGRELPGSDDTLVGESWEIVDIGQTSVSGGGGGSEHSVVANGHLKGKTLKEVIVKYGKQFLGNLELTEDGQFPILIKYLDARGNLSVQVHPSQAYAMANDDAFLKSEAWYIVEAEPGACIYKGIKEGTTPSQFRQAIEDNTVEELMIKIPVKAGQCHYLPSGTCHALGGGILVAEVQTPSDTTFRVYDWGRTSRELHVEQALSCIDFGPADVAVFEKKTHIAGIFTTVSRLVECEHFRIERVRMCEGFSQELPYEHLVIWMVQEGEGSLLTGKDEVKFKKGDTLLIPANMHDTAVKLDADTVWLEVAFPKALPVEID